MDLGDNERLSDESTILRFRHLLEEHHLSAKMLAEVNAVLTERGLMLKEGSAVDATLIAAPSSTKNKAKARDPEMHSSQKGNQWNFGMKAHIGVDADSGLVHTVRCTSGNLRRQNFMIGDAPIQALATENANFDLCHVQPNCVLGGVAELHAPQELGGGATAQYIVKALSEVRVQVIEHQVNMSRFGVGARDQFVDP